MSASGELRFTFLACADLKHIWDAIGMPSDPWGMTASDNLAAAQAFATEFARHCPLLAKSPELGLEREELQNGLRSSSFRKYVIFYRVRGDSVEVMRILRSMRDVEPPA